MKRLLIYIVIFLVVLSGVWIYLTRDRGNPVENFNAFYKVFEENYALFDVKGIDWKKEYSNFSARINEKTTDQELFNIFKEMLDKLDDKHCYIYRFNQIYFSGFDLPPLNYLDLISFDFRLPTNDFSLKLIKKEYLIESEKSLKVYSLLPPMGIRNIFTTGWMQDSIAYLHMTEMSNQEEKVHNSISTFTEKYKNASGYIVDVRDNIGGYSLPIKELAEYFTNDTNIFAISRLRNSENIYSFKEPEYWIINKSNPKYSVSKPIVLLINENTQSAAELFTLMMKTIPTVSVVGDTTSGIFADTHIGKLPNGWEYRLSIRKTNNRNDIELEDTGIIPDTLILNTIESLNSKEDKVLDYAIKCINRKNNAL